MKRTEILAILVIAMGLMVCPAQLAKAATLGTAFTYQGRLIDANGVANGPYDFEFRLFDDPCTGAPLVGTIDINNLDVIEGYFTVELDFGGNVFAGDARWLEIAVRPGDSTGSFDVLSPRQELTPTPYAIYAENAGTDNDWMVSGNHIYSSPSGNVGIGATSPSSKLHVEDNTTGDLILKIHNQNDAGSERLYFGTTTSTDAGIMVYGSSNPTYPGKWRFFNNKTSAHYDWLTNLGVKMTLANDGKVGIGTTTPSSILHVEDSTTNDVTAIIHNLNNAGSERLYFGTGTSSDAGILVYGSTNASYPGKWRFFNNKTSAHYDWLTNLGVKMTLANDGKVGIGTTTPSSILHVEDSTTNDVTAIIHNLDNTGSERLYFGTSTGSDAGISVYGSANAGKQGKWEFFNNKTSGHYDWLTNDSVRMTLTNEGKVGIGSSNPLAKLFIEESGSDDPLRIRVAGSTKLIVKNDGKVGIGTLSPDELLTVVGNVKIDGNLNIYNGATKIMELGAGLDYAEGFDVSAQDKIEPGSVLVIDPDNAGKLALSNKSYDTKVAGIVAGAKGLGSGVRLGAGQFDYDVALAGRVYCNVDATAEAVQPGDLLTTSATPGYAMKAASYVRAQGAILGKAMESLEKGQKGQILVLVTLQ